MSENQTETKYGKSGYEIRTEILHLAKDLVTHEHGAQYSVWQETAERDNQGRITQTSNSPKFPGLEKVLETADKMYAFVNKTK
jgi:hypothetical protein